MRVTICYFASLSEKLGQKEEIVELTSPCSISELQLQLAARGGNWQALTERQVLRAHNHAMANGDEPLSDGDEVAFFPPVTGG